MSEICLEFFRASSEYPFWSCSWCAVPRVGEKVSIPAGYEDDDCESDLPSQLFVVTDVGWGRWGPGPKCSAAITVEISDE